LVVISAVYNFKQWTSSS